ncbi:DnaB-like helicase C-terminal domain-containing protein [Streptomyces sp. 549]|uniref:replicative DNA helicase n=1 Tax=Streptomyces sp. 549 TaxID=3049076 RepID=UPI0024C3670B|nr:DnaB-like helicase C-terminal domain-containing protein [Streptomyces sp. 549]MDK1473668.1 DnaB-like helicase C-terminal domain-containing protein [Streptomyces sp. 549]
MNDDHGDGTTAIDTRMPHDTEAERAVLGGMLLHSAAINHAEAVLGDGAAFYEPRHHTVYRAILNLHGRPGTRPDPITVAAHLRTHGDLDRIGGQGYLHTLAQSIPTASNAAWYAEIVRTQHRLRRIAEIATRASGQARFAEANPEDVLEQLLAEAQELTADATGGTDDRLSVADNWESFVDELDSGDDPDALDSPWHDLNEIVAFKPKELTVVGASTGGGKSLLGMNLGAHIALHRNLPVLVASMEMTRKELIARLTAAEAGVELEHLTRRKLTQDDWRRIAKVDDVMRKAHNFILDDSPGLSVGKIRARVRWMAAQGNAPRMVIVDYMQLITPETTSGAQSRTQEVAKISRDLKLLAAEFGVPVVALAQFNRGQVGRKPLISDFKDSSQIEQDASVILLLHRELAADGSDTGPSAGKVDLIVGKNRNGKQGREVTLQFQGNFGRLASIAPPSWTPSAAIRGVA